MNEMTSEKPESNTAALENIMAGKKVRLLPGLTIKAERSWDGIVWHHSLASDGMTYDWDAIKTCHTSYRVDGKPVSIEEYRKMKIMQRGRAFLEPKPDIGFHIGVEFAEVNGLFVPTIRTGRELNSSGFHTTFPDNLVYNHKYLGFLAVGNFDEKAPPAALWDTCLKVTRAFMDYFKMDEEHVLGHGEVCAKLKLPEKKSCPGKMWDMDEFRRGL